MMKKLPTEKIEIPARDDKGKFHKHVPNIVGVCIRCGHKAVAV
jgi:hypothetical protein